MSRSHISVLLTAIFVAAGAPAGAGPLCKPTLTFGPASFSDMRFAQRTWTARLDVDASRCTSTSGSFNINFIRAIEFGPDVPFSEHFAWREGNVDVSVEFSANEAVLDYALGDVTSCVCRN